LCSQAKTRAETISAEESSDDGYCGDEAELKKTETFYPITYKIGKMSFYIHLLATY